jgi:hypothetical protein
VKTRCLRNQATKSLSPFGRPNSKLVIGNLTPSSVKPADGGDDAWAVEVDDSKLSVKEQYARTTTSVNNEFRYGGHPHCVTIES